MRLEVVAMAKHNGEDLTPALELVMSAVNELRDALETIAGVVDLGGERLFVRANLERAGELLLAASAPHECADATLRAT
jgi:hypothetical protein